MRQIGPTEILLVMLFLLVIVCGVGGVYLGSRIWHRGRRDAERAEARRRQ